MFWIAAAAAHGVVYVMKAKPRDNMVFLSRITCGTERERRVINEVC